MTDTLKRKKFWSSCSQCSNDFSKKFVTIRILPTIIVKSFLIVTYAICMKTKHGTTFLLMTQISLPENIMHVLHILTVPHSAKTYLKRTTKTHLW